MIACHVPASHILLALGEVGIEEDQDHEGGVVGDDRLGAAELSLVHHIQPRGEEDDPGNAVKRCPQQHADEAWSCQ